MHKEPVAEDLFYHEAFKRNRGLVPDSHQEVLRNAHIVIAGLGGVGGVYATTLARLGIGKFTIADSDTFEKVNLNRQAGATTSTIGKEKAQVIEHMVQEINPYATVRRFPALTPENISDFLEEADIVLDGIDFFNIEARRLLFREARARDIPTLTCAPIGFGAALLTFSSHGESFDTYFHLNDMMPRREQLVSFAIGLSPSLIHRSYFKSETIDFKNEAAPSSVVATLACANLVATETYKILNKLPYDVAPICWQVDPYTKKLKRTERNNKHILQRLKKWYFMNKIEQDKV